jgi:hypothetical protein
MNKIAMTIVAAVAAWYISVAAAKNLEQDTIV